MFSKTITALGLALGLTVPALAVAPSAQATHRPAGIHLHASTNLLSFRASTAGAFRFRVIAHHPTGKPSAGKARIYVNGRHLQTRTLYNGRALFRVDRSRLPDNRAARIKVRVIPWNTDLRHRIVTRTVKDRRPMVSSGKRVVSVAKAQVGKPYAWGAAGPRGYDCSGLVVYAYRQATGRRLPHQSGALLTVGKRVSSPRPGTIVWTPGHVSLYVGDGKVVEAATPGTDVRVVEMWQESPVYIQP